MSLQSSTGLRVQIASFNANLQGTAPNRPNLTPWLIPVVDQPPVRSTLTSSTEKNPKFDAESYRSHNPRTGSSHPSLVREAPDFYAVGFQELVPLHVGFSGSSQAALYNTDLDIRKTVRSHQAIVSGNGMYAPIEEGGGPEGYTLLCSVELVGIALFVYARERQPYSSLSHSSDNSSKSMAARVKEIRTSKVGTGIGGVMGNKGAVGVRVVVSSQDDNGPDEILTFVCAHLTAHDHNVQRRNWDWQQIVSRMIFEPLSAAQLSTVQTTSSASGFDPSNVEALKKQWESSTQKISSPPSSSSSSTQSRQKKKQNAIDNTSYTIYDTNHLFVFGDLNHRIALGPTQLNNTASSSGEKQSFEPLTKQALLSALQHNDWTALAPYDQLLNQRLVSPPKAFHGLTELSIEQMAIPPTYKYQIHRKETQKNKPPSSDRSLISFHGSTLSSKRIPGWTDRILWASAPGHLNNHSNHGVEVEFFRSIMEFTHSDHKPVTALFRLPSFSNPFSDQETFTAYPLLSKLNPYPPLSSSHRKVLSLFGWLLDRIVGTLWFGIVWLGGGSLTNGIIEILVLSLITAWWFSKTGSTRNGDIG